MIFCSVVSIISGCVLLEFSGATRMALWTLNLAPSECCHWQADGSTVSLVFCIETQMQILIWKMIELWSTRMSEQKSQLCQDSAHLKSTILIQSNSTLFSQKISISILAEFILLRPRNCYSFCTLFASAMFFIFATRCRYSLSFSDLRSWPDGFFKITKKVRLCLPPFFEKSHATLLLGEKN